MAKDQEKQEEQRKAQEAQQQKQQEQQQKQQDQQKQQQQKAAQEREAKEKQAAERKAKLPRHAQDALQQMSTLTDRAQRAVERIKFRLADGTFTEQELAELKVSFDSTLGDEGKEIKSEKSARELFDEQPKPSQMGQPRMEMKKNEDHVQKQIDMTLEKIAKQQEIMNDANASEQEIMEARETYQAMVNKLERLAGPGNPAEA